MADLGMNKCQPVTLLTWTFCNDKHMIDKAPAFTIDSVCTCMFGDVIKIIEQTEESNVEVDSNSAYKVPINMSKHKSTFDDVINGVQVDDPELQEVCRFSAYWTTMVEVCAGYNDINTIVGRANASLQCYQQMQIWKNGGASE